MEKPVLNSNFAPPQRPEKARQAFHSSVFLVLGAAFLYILYKSDATTLLTAPCHDNHSYSPYGRFPQAKDPFQFLPCTSETLPPPLDDPDPEKTWAALFDPEPSHWSWARVGRDDGSDRGDSVAGGENHSEAQLGVKRFASSSEINQYAGRGVYLCGYLDVPLDYTNDSDPRIARLAVTRFQVSGLKTKTNRTLIVEPGGPGGSGTSYAWRAAEDVTQRLSESTLDVLGWDPRGVNASLPGISCFPYDSDRDRWALLTTQSLFAVGEAGARAQLELVDAMNEATFAACKEQLGDLPRFMSTAFVARDLDRIREALGEEVVSGYFVSYGTGIGQTYANVFPTRIGSLILDGTEYVRDHRLLGGFGWTALDNGTDAWHDGFLGECLAAGPEHCALAQPLSPKDGERGVVTLPALETRMTSLLASLAQRPFPVSASSSGPSLITFSALIQTIYGALYSALTWPTLAQALWDLEHGNATLAAQMLDRSQWEFQPPAPCPATAKPAATDELAAMVICADASSAPQKNLDFYAQLWENMTAKSWVAGDSRFYDILPCRHYTPTFGLPAETYTGDLNATLSHPILLIAETYDPATPLRNGRRLLEEMGENARLVVHHGYGHSSRDKSACTDRIVRDFVQKGSVPNESETECWADGKPYRYDEDEGREALEVWREHLREEREFGGRIW